MSNKSNMTIIGGTRGLGRWMAEHLRNDFNITITSRDAISGRKIAEELNVDYTNDNIDAVKDANIILFAFPLSLWRTQLKRWRPMLLKGHF